MITLTDTTTLNTFITFTCCSEQLPHKHIANNELLTNAGQQQIEPNGQNALGRSGPNAHSSSTTRRRRGQKRQRRKDRGERQPILQGHDNGSDNEDRKSPPETLGNHLSNQTSPNLSEPGMARSHGSTTSPREDPSEGESEETGQQGTNNGKSEESELRGNNEGKTEESELRGNNESKTEESEHQGTNEGRTGMTGHQGEGEGDAEGTGHQDKSGNKQVPTADPLAGSSVDNRVQHGSAESTHSNQNTRAGLGVNGTDTADLNAATTNTTSTSPASKRSADDHANANHPSTGTDSGGSNSSGGNEEATEPHTPVWWTLFALMEQICPKCGQRVLRGQMIKKDTAVEKSMWAHYDCAHPDRFGTPRKPQQGTTPPTTPQNTVTTQTSSQNRSSNKTSAPGASIKALSPEVQLRVLKNKMMAYEKQYVEFKRKMEDKPTVDHPQQGASQTDAALTTNDQQQAAAPAGDTVKSHTPSPIIPSLDVSSVSATRTQDNNSTLRPRSATASPSQAGGLLTARIRKQQRILEKIIEDNNNRKQAQGAAQDEDKQTMPDVKDCGNEVKKSKQGHNRAPAMDDDHDEGQGNTTPEDDYNMDEDSFICDYTSELESDKPWQNDDEDDDEDDEDDDDNEDEEEDIEYIDESDSNSDFKESSEDDEDDDDDDNDDEDDDEDGGAKVKATFKRERKARNAKKPVRYIEQEYEEEYDEDGNPLEKEWDKDNDDHESGNPFGSDNDDDVSIRTEDEPPQSPVRRDKKNMKQTTVPECRPFHVKGGQSKKSNDATDKDTDNKETGEVEIVDLGNERPTTADDGNANNSGQEDGTNNKHENKSNNQEEDTKKQQDGDNGGSK